jgi:hypothetical protein
MISESLQLRMVAISFRFALEDLLCEQGFSPQGAQSFCVEILGMDAPQPHGLSLHRWKLRKAAKLTHPMYGMSRVLAGRETLPKVNIVAHIATQRIKITTKPASGDLIPKKKKDHKTFKTR